MQTGGAHPAELEASSNLVLGRGITVSHAFKVVQRLTGQFLTRSIGFIRNSRFQRGHRWTRVALAQSLFKLQVAAVSILT